MIELQDRVDFSCIRYANCWEDAAVLLHAIEVKGSNRILIIASAGDNALALLSQSPESVHAVDLSLPQIYLCALKQAGFAWLDYDEVLLLLGITANQSIKRWQVYQKLRAHLQTATSDYWDNHRVLIEGGVIHQGKFEHYFALFRRWLLPLVHNRATVLRLLHSKDEEEQQTFFAESWNTWRWQLLMNIFFSKAVMGRYGRDPQFLKHVAINVPNYIRAKAESHLQSSAATRNPFLEYIFRGIFRTHLPVYLQEKHFTTIKQNIGRLQLSTIDMNVAVINRKYDVYCASNIFEYMSADEFGKAVQAWSEVIQPAARIAFWNLMVPRSFAEVSPEAWRNTGYAPDTDMGFFYSRFLLEQKI